MPLPPPPPPQSPIPLKGLELLLDVTFLIAPAKHKFLNRLKEHIDTKYKMPKELELKGSKKLLKVNSKIKTRSMTLKIPRKIRQRSFLKIKMCPMVNIWIHQR